MIDWNKLWEKFDWDALEDKPAKYNWLRTIKDAGDILQRDSDTYKSLLEIACGEHTRLIDNTRLLRGISDSIDIEELGHEVEYDCDETGYIVTGYLLHYDAKMVTPIPRRMEK